VDREYLDWLKQLPVNRGSPKTSWVGIYRTDDSFESFEAWQARIVARDAQRGVIARWLRWMS
jgi:hypothetical protein